MRLNRGGRVPPSDGVSHWRFPVGAIVIRAKGYDDLIKNVFEYRLRNNLPIGNIENEISSYYCAKYPRFCHAEASDSNPSAGAMAVISDQPLLNRVSMWVSATAHRMPRGGYPLVAAAEAERRAAICLSCPKNRAWLGGCSGCSSITLQLTHAVKGMRRTAKDGNLMACEIGGFELGAAIWLPTAGMPITDVQRAAMPENCWRKAEL